MSETEKAHIEKSVSRLSLNGTEIERKYLRVCGDSVSECRTIFQEEWEK